MPLTKFYIAFILVFCYEVAYCQTNDLIVRTERLVNKLSNAVSAAYSARCNITCPVCVSSACSSRRPPKSSTCTPLYGDTDVISGRCTYQCNLRKVDYNFSNILTSSSEETEQISEERCWTDAIDTMFKENFSADKTSGSLRWQYFASSSGLIRLYPAHTLQACHVLNPLVRPWYVAATSGPKNVIIILDVSASMLNNNRLDIAKDAAKVVIETLTNVDYAGIVVFSDSGRQLLVANQRENSLLRTTYANIELLSGAVSNITGDPEGATNFEAAFLTAFDILDANISSSNCHTAILFLTDGFPNKGQTSQNDIVSLIQERNTHHNAIMFTYTLGSYSGASYTRAIACETGGIYTQINSNKELRKQLSLYYDYFTSLRHSTATQVAWVEPYEDAVGAGLLVTASKAVYENTSEMALPRLIGVVGVDVSVSNLQKSLASYERVIRVLSERNSCPPIENYDQRTLDRIRARQGGVPCGSCDDCEGNVSNHCARPMERVEYCNYSYQRYETNSELYRDDSCCFSHGNSSVVKLCSRAYATSTRNISTIIVVFSCVLSIWKFE